jgi:hypothetical protein
MTIETPQHRYRQERVRTPRREPQRPRLAEGQSDARPAPRGPAHSDRCTVVLEACTGAFYGRASSKRSDIR